MAGKQTVSSDDEYEAIRVFRHSDLKTFQDTHYQPGDDYTHPVEENQLSPDGPDGQGPVIAVKKKAVTSSSIPAVSASKEN